MRSSRTILLAALLAGSLLGCNRPGKPSPEYAQAREKWTALLKERLDGAAADPRAEEVLALLARVDAKSSDAKFAADLRAQIEAGRREAQAREAEVAANLEKAREALRAQAAAPADIAPEPSAAAVPAPEPTAAAAPDAGTGPTQPTDGMSASEFQEKFSRCFEYRSDALVGGQNGGKVYGLKDLSLCRDLHPGFISNSVLVFDGKIAVRSSAELAPKKYELVDGKLVPAEEAQAARKKKAAAEAAALPAP